MKIKPWVKTFIKKNHEWITVLICIVILILALYSMSLLIYPEWRDSPRGNIILLSMILLGILVNLKNIIDLLEKWLIKKDKYQFSNEEIEAIKWLNEEFINKRSIYEFRFGYFPDGTIFIQKPDGFRNETSPTITKGILSMLMNRGLIWFENDLRNSNQYMCRIFSVPTKKAIESNFSGN